LLKNKLKKSLKKSNPPPSLKFKNFKSAASTLLMSPNLNPVGIAQSPASSWPPKKTSAISRASTKQKSKKF
jgi:hypothetical protein